MRVLIVGGSSYLGRSLCRKLADVCQVWGTFFRSAVAFAGTRVHLDVSDRDEAADILRRTEPDVIFYLACDFNDLKKSIVNGTGNLLKPRQMNWPASRFVYISSDAVFDGESAPAVECPHWKHEPGGATTGKGTLCRKVQKGDSALQGSSSC